MFYVWSLIGLMFHRTSVSSQHPPHPLRQFQRVRHDDERHAFLAVQLHEQLAERGGGGVVERAGGFVGEQELRLVDQRANDGHALAFAAAQLAGAMVQSFAEANAFEQTRRRGLRRIR